MDEATGGLDPVIRDDVLDMLLDFVQDESHSVLVSSHIISDLEKVADYVTFLHKGKLVFTHEKDELIDNYGVVSCGAVIKEKVWDSPSGYGCGYYCRAAGCSEGYRNHFYQFSADPAGSGFHADYSDKL